MALSQKDLIDMPLGTEIKAGVLLRNLDPDSQVVLRMVENQKTKMTFNATYAGIHLGEVYYTVKDSTWRASWR